MGGNKEKMAGFAGQQVRSINRSVHRWTQKFPRERSRLSCVWDLITARSSGDIIIMAEKTLATLFDETRCGSRCNAAHDAMQVFYSQRLSQQVETASTEEVLESRWYSDRQGTFPFLEGSRDIIRIFTANTRSGPRGRGSPKKI
jgi:hypothetical protein